MEYKNLKFDPSEMSFVPQTDGLIGSGHVDAPNSLRNFKTNDSVDGLDVPDGIKFRHRAKFTDILICSEISFPYLLISDKFLDVFSQLRLPRHQIFPIKVIKKDKIVPYNIFISKECFAEYIDFENSSFFVSSLKNGAPYREPIAITDANGFWEKYNKVKESTYIAGLKIMLNYSMIKYDLFRLPRGIGGPNYIVSEAFVTAINEAGLTGIAFSTFEGTQ